MPSTNCLPVSILRSFVCYGGNELQSKMSFDDFLLYKGDEIDNVAYAYTPDLVRDTFSPAASVYPAQIGFSVVAKRCAQKSRKLVLQYIVIG